MNPEIVHGLNSAATQVVAEGARLYVFYGISLLILAILLALAGIAGIISIKENKEEVKKEEPTIAVLLMAGALALGFVGLRLLIAPTFHATAHLLSQIGG